MLDPDLIARRRRRRFYLKLAGAIALLLLIGFFAARPVRHAIKGWQARRHAERAFAFINAEKWEEATREARAAYQLRPGEPDAIRAVARLLTRTRSPEAPGFWKALREKTSLTRDDLREEAGAALAAGDLSLAQTAVAQLLGKKAGGPGPADYLLAAQVAAQNGRREQALDLLGKTVAAKNVRAHEQLGASVLQLTLASPDLPQAREIQTAAWTRLSNLARGHDQVALDALAILTQQTLSSPNEIVRDPAIMPEEELVRALRTHPLSGVAQKLLALDLEMHADAARRDALIAQAIATWGNADNDTLVILGRWLNGKGEFQRELDTIPLRRALQSRDLFLQRLDALGALGEWSEIKRLLIADAFPLDPVIERMYLARCNQQLGEITAAENNWDRAFEAAAGDPQKLLTFAEYAEKNDATEAAARAYDTIVREAPSVRAAQQGRLRLAQRSRDTHRIHAILVEMLKQWPNDTAVQNDEAYVRLLLASAKEEGRRMKNEVDSGQLPRIAQVAGQLVQRDPASLPHRTLLALARLRLGEPEKALEVYNNIRMAPGAASASAIVVHAAVLAANGEREAARTEVSSLKPDQLLPEEAAMVEEVGGGSPPSRN